MPKPSQHTQFLIKSALLGLFFVNGASATFAADMPMEKSSALALEEGVPPTKGDRFYIQEAQIVDGIAGEVLVVNLEYGGGCREHIFRAFWDGSFIKTNPPGIDVKLWHDAQGDPCRAIKPKQLVIDLSQVGTFGFVNIIPANRPKGITVRR